jgi:glucose/arabinose dehydrogenase
MKTMGSVYPFILALFVSLFCMLADAQRILIDDFELTTEIGQYGNPTDITFLPDGALLAANKNGIITVSRLNQYDDPQPALDVSALVCENGERGLLSVTSHPDYGVNNPYIFIKYTFNRNGCADDPVTGPVNRLSRFTLDPVTYTADLNSEVVYLDTPALPFDHHNAGDVQIGKVSTYVVCCV